MIAARAETFQNNKVCWLSVTGMLKHVLLWKMCQQWSSIW